MLHHRETATQDKDLNGFQVREVEDHLMVTTVQEMAMPGEVHKEIQTHTVEDHLMAMEVLDDQMETDHRLEDHLVGDRQGLDFQIHIHQVHQETLQVQQVTEDVNTSQIDVFETCYD